MKNQTRLALGLLGGASVLAIASLAGAAVAAPAEGAAGAGDAGASKAAAVQEVVVTGSRTIRNGNNSPTPMTVLPVSQFQNLMPNSVVEELQLVPALQGTQSITSNPGGGQRNGAAAYIDLRDMGDLRTLVLMDGHRVVPTINQNQGNTDSWVIPQMLIKRIDVVTGGVSAVYGSDAVSGVVNFITDSNFNGVKVEGSTGVSTYGDDKINDFGIAGGASIAGGRGHIEGSYEWHSDPGIPNQLARPWFAQSLGGAGLGTLASPYYNAENERISTTSFGGLINSGPLAGMQFATNGVLSPFAHGASTGTSGVESGGDGGWYDTASIKSAIHFHQVFGRLDYDFTDTLHGYLQVAGTENHTQDAFRAPLESVTLAYCNPFAQAVAQLAAQCLSNPTGTFSFSRLFNIPATADQYTNTYMIHGGLNGELGKYKWDIGFGRSSSWIEAENDVNVNQGRFLAAVNAVSSGGTTVCNAALTNPDYAGCVPLNMFGPTAQSAAAMKYVLAHTWNQNTTDLTELTGQITGAPFDTWAGPVNMALSGEVRRESWVVTSNAGPNDPIDCTGIQFGCTASGISKTAPWLQTTMPALPEKTQGVSEVAIEANVPLVKDKPFFDSLNLNLAGRYTDYSTSGAVETWKVGLVWHLDQDLTLRGTVSRDIRAPNLFELYAPTTIAPTTLSDPLTHTSGKVGIATISNSALVPEVASSMTGGFVWQPHYLPGFSLSVDAYRIKVQHAIAQVSGGSSSVLQLCDSTLGANPVCSTITRPFPYTNTTAANFPTALTQQWQNIASFDTYGADFEGGYHTKVFGRNFDLRGLIAWQPHLVFNQGPAGIIDLGDAATGVNLYPASANLKYTFVVSYDVTDQLNLSLLQHGQGALKAVGIIEGQPQKVFLNGSYDPAITYTNLTATYKVHSDTLGNPQVYFSVQNLFNQQPEVRYAGANSSPGVGLSGFFPPNGEDIVGRYFTVGFRSKF
jgi:outer membrane receptor protein involved in Fe transport